MAVWPQLVHERMRRLLRLAQGEGDRLWQEHDWKAQFKVSNTIKRITPDKIHSVMQKSLAAQHPARTFKRLTSIPFCPPTARVADILLLQTNVNSTPNSDAEWIQQQAALHLPRKPHSRIQTPDGSEALSITKHWARIIDDVLHTGQVPLTLGSRHSRTLSLKIYLKHPFRAHMLSPCNGL